MTKDIKDYLPFYLGRMVMFKGKRWELLAYNKAVRECTLDREDAMEVKNVCKHINEVKPILRPLSDMTEEEIKEFINWNKLNEMYVDVSFIREKTGIVINYGVDVMDYVEKLSHKITFTEWSPNEFLWMLKKGFDLFGLIESGHAIDKTKTSEQ